ncbi:membrane protein [Spirochaetia bacterium]|nr:membrane protein [Spirochaetia bacterium]
MPTDFLYTIVIYPIVQIIEVVFSFSQKVFKEPGISLLVISLVVNMLCLPLYDVAEKRQVAERNLQKKFKLKIDKIKNAFKGDEQYMILSTFYRQNQYHPIYALRSSFGLLIQIPFFIAAYSYLSHLEALKEAHFLFFRDLGKPDGLLSLSGISINVLPVLMTLINTISGFVYTRGLLFRDKIQVYGIAVIFLLLLYNSPAGLVIYWTMNNIFSLLKNLYYSISFKYKNKLLIGAFTISCVFISYYMMGIYRGDYHLRVLCTTVFLFMGILPWLFPLLKRFMHKIPTPAYSGKNVFLAFIISFLAIWFIIGLFLPSMLIGSSPQEFSYIDSYSSPLFFIGNTALQAFGFFVFWPVCLYFLFSNKVKTAFSVLGPVILVCGICNIFLFPGNYGIITLELVYNIDINHKLMQSLVNLGVLAFIAIPVCILYFSKKLNILILVVFVSIFSFFGVSAYNMILIQREFNKLEAYHAPSRNQISSIDPVFQLSRNGMNTVVIMLDRALGAFIPFIFEESPELNRMYTGFTWYPNTVSFNGFTALGAPPLFGGYEYTPLEINKRDTETLANKHNEALLLMPRIFADAGFLVTVSDQPYPNYNQGDPLAIYNSWPGIKAMNTDSRYSAFWMKEHDFHVPTTGTILKRNLIWYSIFKTAPLAFRRGIYLQGDWCAPGLFRKMNLTLNGYAVLDYMSRLTAVTDKEQNTALIMVNNTTHEASFLQAPDFRPALTVTNFGTSPFAKEVAYHVNSASIKRLGEWFDFLKAEGVYDNTRIVLAADHGITTTFVTKTNLPFPVDNFNPLLMVKDFNAAGDFKTDMTFMSNADVPFLALSGQIENPINPFTDKPVTADLKNEPLYIAVSGYTAIENPRQTQFTLNPQKDYYVHDNIFDQNNWSKADK